MVSYADLTDRSAVEDALDEFDRIGRFTFLEKYGFGEAREYFLVTETGRYDSKAIFAVAYRNQHGVDVGSGDISGGKHGAARRLQELGYTIEGLDDERGRRTYATFDAALADFPRIPVENLPAIREFLTGRSFREAYIPRSMSYIAMVPTDGGPVHYINPGSIYYRKPDGSGALLTLPVSRLVDSGFTRGGRTPARSAELCPVCWLELPLSGECPNH